MLLDPDGKSHLVTERECIGVRDGVITKITAKRVVIREKTINVLGQEEVVVTEIKLPERKSLMGERS